MEFYQENFKKEVEGYPDLSILLKTYERSCKRDEKITKHEISTAEGKLEITKLWDALKAESLEPRLSLPCVPAAVMLIGRDKSLAKFDAELVKNKQICVVLGIGGVGKTEFIKEYLNTYYNQAAQKGWFVYREGFAETLLTDKSLVSNPRAPEDDPQARMNEILSLLRKLTNNDVLIFDNVHGNLNTEDMKIILELPCKVIFTTRSRLSDNQFKVFPLDYLSEQDCILLFEHYYKKNVPESQREDLKAIITLAGQHTLALELIAKTCKACHKSVMEILKLLEDDGFTLEGLATKVRREGSYC